MTALTLLAQMAASVRKGDRRREGLPATPARSRFNINKWLFAIHGWCGLSLGLPLFIICLSGSIAVVSHEIDWLFTPALRADGPAGPVNWEAILETVRREYPARPVQSLWAPVGPGFAAEAWLGTPQGNERIYLEPATGEILGVAPWFNTQRFFRDFHRRFFWYSQWGITLVSLFAIPLLISAVTGLLFYKRWWVKLFTLRFHKGARVLWSDTHRLAGAWTFLFAILIAVTGLWYLVEKPVSRSVREYVVRAERMDRDALDERDSNARPLPLSELVDAARAASPGLEVKAIFPPSDHDDPILIDGQASAWLVRDRANRVTLDPFSGEVLGAKRAEELHPVWRWSHTADVLHFGTFGGLPVKFIWLGFGLMLSLLMPTGVYLFMKRAEFMLAGAIKKAAREKGESSTAVRIKPRGTGWFGLIATSGILILAAVTTFQSVREQIPTRSVAAVEMESQTLGMERDTSARLGREPIDWLGGWQVVAFCGGFLLLIGVSTVYWYRMVWFRGTRNAGKPRRMHSR